MALRILVFAGALRDGSLNRKLAAEAARRAEALGAEVDRLDLREVDMPLYDGDLEQRSGLPGGARAFVDRIRSAQAVVIASPEYNWSIPGTLKNAIDWTSRPKDQPWKGKIALLLSASPGFAGGVRMLPDLRKVLTTLGVFVIPSMVSVPKADGAFDAAGALTSDAASKALDKALAELLEIGNKLFP